VQLRDFVGQTLRHLIEAVHDAQDETAGSGALVNPRRVNGADAALGNLLFLDDGRAVSLISFDVSIEASQEKGASGQMGIAVAAVSLGLGGNRKARSASVGSVSFSVPVAFPVTIEEKG